MHHNIRTLFVKVIVIGLALIFNMSYVIFSYDHAAQTLRDQEAAKLLRTKEDINEAIQGFLQYLNLTQARLSHSFDNPEMIPRILSENIEQVVGKHFPVIMSMAFFPTSSSTLVYTRFGKALDKTVKYEEGIFYLGKGAFEWVRKFSSGNEQELGVLDAVMSLSKILYQNFSESEIDIFPINNVDLTKNRLSFKIDDLPYTVAANGRSLTLWQFLLESKLHILSVVLLSLMAFFVGVAAGASVIQRAFVKQRAFIHRLKGKLKGLEKKNSHTELQLVASQNLVKRREHSQKAKHLLTNGLGERYRQMAAQAQAINMWTSQLILEVAQNDHLLEKIHSVSQEGTSVLRQLVNGFPMKFIEEEIDILERIENIKEIFTPEMMEKNINFEIRGKVKKQPRVDKIIFEIILHNIFHTIVDRLSKNGVLIIEFKKDNPHQIHFYDSGYDVGPKIQLVKDSLPEDILCLSQSRLEEFTSYLGYKLSFENTGILANTIRLTFPFILEESECPSNVVPLFDNQSHEN